MYPLMRAEWQIFATQRGQCLNLEAYGDVGAAQKTTSDISLGLPSVVGVEISFYSQSFDPAKLAGKQFQLDCGWDEDANDLDARFEYFRHDNIDRNVVKFLERFEDESFRVVWTGEACDPNHYDESKRRTIIRVDGRFYPPFVIDDIIRR